MTKLAGTTGQRREISYIVRVYRCDGEIIVGVIEIPAQDRSIAFRSFTELKEILSGTSVTPGHLREPGRK